jgi:hypothetical protein
MLPGAPSPELPTDQQCDHCGRWFRTKGIESHEENCPVGQSESLQYDRGEYLTVQCEECGVWATEQGTRHQDDCSSSGAMILPPARLPQLEPEDFA